MSHDCDDYRTPTIRLRLRAPDGAEQSYDFACALESSLTEVPVGAYTAWLEAIREDGVDVASSNSETITVSTTANELVSGYLQLEPEPFGNVCANFAQ